MMKGQDIDRRPQLDPLGPLGGRGDHQIGRGDHAVGRKVVLGEPEAVIAELLGVHHLFEVLLEQLLDAALIGLGDG